MARAFASASSQKLQHDNAAATDVPLTIACWMRTASAATTQVAMAIGRRATQAQRYQLYFTSGGRIGGYCQNSAGTQVATFNDSSGVNYSANTWYHGAVVFNTTTDRTVYRDGGNSTNNTTSVTVGTVDTTNIGTRFDGASFGVYLNGQIAEPAVWNVALSAGEIAQLAKGVSPLMVRPEALVAYWPLYGNNSPEDDWINDFDLTVTGATKAAHPRVIYPLEPKLFAPAASGNSQISGSAAYTITPSGTLIGKGALSGSSTVTLAGSAILAGKGALSGQSQITFTPTGSLTAASSGSIAGSASITITPAATITARGSLSGSASISLSASGVLTGLGANQPAGRSRRKRWAVEHDGELIEFSTAQAAVAWIGRQRKKAKTDIPARKSSAPRQEMPEPVQFTALQFDGVKIGKMMVDGQQAIKRLMTMKEAEIAMVERFVREQQEEEEFLLDFISRLD
jgi:hypothetical protein